MIKKICVLSSVHNWEDTRIFEKQCKSLAKKYDVTYLAPAKKSIEFSQNLRLCSLQTWEKISDRKKIRKELFSKIKNLDAEIFHFHDPELIFIGLYMKFVKRKKIIYDVHEDVAKQILDKVYIPTKLFRKFIAFAYWILEQITIRFMDGVIVAGEDILESYKYKTIINNYPVLRSENNLEKDGSIVYIGNLNAIYGIHQMVEAVKLLNDKFDRKIYLKLIGKFDNDKLKSEIMSKYGNYIKYLGWMKQDKVYEEVSKSLIGLVNYLPLPNHFKLRSNKLFEYMECSLPVVYPDFDDWKNKLGIYEVGIAVDPLNVNQIAEALNTLLQDSHKRKAYASNSRKTVEKYYNWKSEENKLFSLYKKLLRN